MGVLATTIEDDYKIEMQSHMCLTLASSKIESIESKSNKSCDYDPIRGSIGKRKFDRLVILNFSQEFIVSKRKRKSNGQVSAKIANSPPIFQVFPAKLDHI